MEGAAGDRIEDAMERCSADPMGRVRAFRDGLPAGRVWLYASLVDLGPLPPGAPGKEVARGRKIWSRKPLRSLAKRVSCPRGEAPERSAGVRVLKVVCQHADNATEILCRATRWIESDSAIRTRQISRDDPRAI